MAVPVWATNQVLLASDVNTWFVPLAAYKTSATGRTSTTLVIDPDLQITLAASAVYDVHAAIIHQTTGGSSAFSFAWTSPTLVSSTYAATYAQPGPVIAGWGHGFDGTAVAVAASDNLVHGINIMGTVTVSSTGGTFGLSWAAATASSGTVSVLTGSLLTARRIG
jgi:hypothetical protein